MSAPSGSSWQLMARSTKRARPTSRWAGVILEIKDRETKALHNAIMLAEKGFATQNERFNKTK